MLMGNVAAAAEALAALSLPPRALVLLDVRNPLHHLALIIALGLLGRPSASVGSNFAVEKAGVAPHLLLTDRDTPGPAGLRTLRLDDRWFAFDAATPIDYARLLALPGFSAPTEIVRYVFSSGTTGHPKCVALTEATLELRVFHVHLTAEGTGSDAAINLMGFSTIAGILLPMVTLPTGMLLCFPRDIADALAMVRLFNVGAMILAVAHLHAMLPMVAAEPPPEQLRALHVAGSRLPRALLMEARARLCSNLSFGYGSTEMGAMAGGTAASLERYEGSAGYLRPWVEMQVVDAEGRQVPAGSDGIIRVRSPEMASYAGAANDPVEHFRDGWFYPGDVGRLHPDGLVVITGRTSEVINRGGVIVAPELIEEVLRRDPAVRDVAVVGVPRNGLDEIWAAVVADGEIAPQALADRAAPAQSVTETVFR
jgi:acyl-coenzyme A synthetase/AMP-(fatty) acid ligase